MADREMNLKFGLTQMNHLHQSGDIFLAGDLINDNRVHVHSLFCQPL